MESKPLISEFMTPEPCGIDEDLSLADAVDRMQANNIRHLLVLRDGELLGVIDSGDLALTNATTTQVSKKILVSQAARGVFRCPPDAALTDVVRTMESQHFGCAAVVDDRGDVVGIFTVTDAFRALRSVLAGHDTTPQIEPTHHPDLPKERQAVLPSVRVKRLLRHGNAAPAASDGMLLGSTV